MASARSRGSAGVSLPSHVRLVEADVGDAVALQPLPDDALRIVAKDENPPPRRA